MEYINQHSFTLSAIGLVLLVAWLLLRDGVSGRDLLALGLLVGALVGSFALVQPGPSSPLDAAQARALIGGGRAVLLEFQSPY